MVVSPHLRESSKMGIYWLCKRNRWLFVVSISFSMNIGWSRIGAGFVRGKLWNHQPYSALDDSETMLPATGGWSGNSVRSGSASHTWFEYGFLKACNLVNSKIACKWIQWIAIPLKSLYLVLWILEDDMFLQAFGESAWKSHLWIRLHRCHWHVVSQKAAHTTESPNLRADRKSHEMLHWSICIYSICSRATQS